MKILVIYDSVFGNTEKTAQSIAAALGTQAIPVSQVDAGKLRGLDLLVVGSPTRGFRPTEGLSKLLNTLPKNHLAGVCVAAFDTRIVLETIDSKALRFLVDKGGYAAQLPPAPGCPVRRSHALYRAQSQPFFVQPGSDYLGPGVAGREITPLKEFCKGIYSWRTGLKRISPT